MADTPGAPAAPIAPAAPAVAPAPPTHPNGIQNPLSVQQAHTAYTDLVASNVMTREAANAAMAAEGIAPPDAVATARSDAQAAIDRIFQGRDKAFSKAYTDPSDPGHAAAVAKMAALRAAVSANTPPAAPKPSEAQVLHQAGVAPIEFELAFSPGDLPSVRAESQRAANQVAQAMGIEPELAQTAVRNLAKAINARQSVDPATGDMTVGKMMDGRELGQMDNLLKRQWGPAHKENLAYAESALKSAGKAAAWIKSSMRAAGPLAAAMAFNSLAAHGRALAARAKR